MGKLLLLCEVNATFFNFLLKYMRLFCNEYAGIMKSCKPRIFCVEIGNLCGEGAAYFTKFGPRMNMQTLADYALNYAIA